MTYPSEPKLLPPERLAEIRRRYADEQTASFWNRTRLLWDVRLLLSHIAALEAGPLDLDEFAGAIRQAFETSKALPAPFDDDKRAWEFAAGTAFHRVRAHYAQRIAAQEKIKIALEEQVKRLQEVVGRQKNVIDACLPLMPTEEAKS